MYPHIDPTLRYKYPFNPPPQHHRGDGSDNMKQARQAAQPWPAGVGSYNLPQAAKDILKDAEENRKAYRFELHKLISKTSKKRATTHESEELGFSPSTLSSTSSSGGGDSGSNSDDGDETTPPTDLTVSSSPSDQEYSGTGSSSEGETPAPHNSPVGSSSSSDEGSSENNSRSSSEDTSRNSSESSSSSDTVWPILPSQGNPWAGTWPGGSDSESSSSSEGEAVPNITSSPDSRYSSINEDDVEDGGQSEEPEG
jgi:hypothetical protein